VGGQQGNLAGDQGTKKKKENGTIRKENGIETGKKQGAQVNKA